MRDNAQLPTHWMAEHTPASFEHDRKTFYAVTRCLEIISEASRSLPKELRDRHPEIPWRRMMDAGNVYRHQYDNVAEAFVWDTVHDDLAALLTIVESELADITAFATQEPMQSPAPEEPHPDRPNIDAPS
jgi:uncharacterized protein with HEPN domain